MKKLLTIVVPTYNRVEDLQECLSYVIPQVIVHKDKVHIYISDNASTDNTKEIVEGIMAKYPDIIDYYCQEKNLTASPHFDAAVHRVDSEYIYMLSDDDFIVPECITFLLRCIETYPDVEYFYLNQYVADDDMRGVYLYNKNICKGYVSVYDTGAELIKNHYDGPSCISANMFRKNVWADASYLKKDDCPGYVWLSILFQGAIHKKSAFIQYPMFTARLPKVQRYVTNWPWYYIKGLGQMFKYLDSECSGLYDVWLNHQQKTNKRQFLIFLTMVADYKKLYRERRKEMKEHISSKIIRVYYDLLVTVIPGWFANKVLRNVIRTTKVFQYF